MPSKKRLLRKIVQPWFQQQQQQEQEEKMASGHFIKEFEQEFIHWLLIALRESDRIGPLKEIILKGKSIDGETLRELFRVGDDNGMSGLEFSNGQESGNGAISWRKNKNQVIGSQGEQDGGHQSLDLEQIEFKQGTNNNENLEKEGVDDKNKSGSNNELSPIGESLLKWFVQDGKGTIRRRPSSTRGSRSGKLADNHDAKNDWSRPYNLEQLLSQFKRHQESEESISQSDESGIESLTQDSDDDEEDDNELDKTLVPQDP